MLGSQASGADPLGHDMTTGSAPRRTRNRPVHLGLLLVAGLVNIDLGVIHDLGLGWMLLLAGVLAIVSSLS